MRSLEGKIILVTGAGRGFGKYMTLAYAQEGAKIVAVARSTNELDSLKETIEKKGGNCILFPTDLAILDDMIRLSDFVKKQFGRLDTLVNCAADSPWNVYEDTSIEEWDRTISVNLRAPFVLSKLFFPMMKQQGRASIINITSTSAQMGFIAEVGYCPSKYGIEGLTQCLAMELHHYNIAVNSLNVSAPEGKRMKPSKLTLSEEYELPNEIKAKYASEDEMVEAFSEAWSFLALQDAHGVTGQRFGTKQLADYLKENGWDAAVANWKNKLTKAVYVSYDLPEKVIYEAPNVEKLGVAGKKERFFSRY
jgi:NAD(P)-dependent dehydrogenase (short-subunit alcohol dehydrogenase family)